MRTQVRDALTAVLTDEESDDQKENRVREQDHATDPQQASEQMEGQARQHGLQDQQNGKDQTLGEEGVKPGWEEMLKQKQADAQAGKDHQHPDPAGQEERHRSPPFMEQTQDPDIEGDVPGRLVQQPAKHHETGQQKHHQTQHPVE
ncbi:hypothetical protein KSB_72980 [Ktedonobacter robiniae]|uniref:Uncharacterized protein n=1 Tax=Ktedonobacter robiniae TaxID=2778365 RepID=A0ABQ3V1I4_9CHLR|nr:hypothetical protein KSB_72980 [Ktedonobacter robiniae]